MSNQALPPLPTTGNGAATGRFRSDVLRGLSAPRKEIPCKYFYDETGSKLFARICELPEYYLTRTELAIMRRHAGEMADLLGRECLLIEYGSGTGLKTRLLLDRLAAPTAYAPIDISREQLRQTAAALSDRYPDLNIVPLCADFTMPLDLPQKAVQARRRAVYFPGSTVGNLTPAEAVELLRRTARLCGPGGGLLLGADLKKDPALLHAAYNDAAGVTAAFNLNLLTRANRELNADFRPDDFRHYAFYHPGEGRIEMHLVSNRDQEARVGPRTFRFAEGESIRTEYSYKYRAADLRALGADAGFELKRSWSDENNLFGVFYFMNAE